MVTFSAIPIPSVGEPLEGWAVGVGEDVGDAVPVAVGIAGSTVAVAVDDRDEVADAVSVGVGVRSLSPPQAATRMIAHALTTMKPPRAAPRVRIRKLTSKPPPCHTVVPDPLRHCRCYACVCSTHAIRTLRCRTQTWYE
jgi:hypothetical protein